MKRIAVSACLLGEKVRYDGDSKALAWLIETLKASDNLYSFCPELFAGMSVPRPSIGIHRSKEGDLSLNINESGKDITHRTLSAFENLVENFKDVNLVILKSKSPSCGIHSASIHLNGSPTKETTEGLFAKTLKRRFPHILYFEDTDLVNEGARRKILEILKAESNQITD